MVASETGKLGIIRRAREAVTPPVIRYAEVRRAGRAFLSDMARNTRLINAAISEMEMRADDPGLTAFVREDARLSIDALRHLLGMQNQRAAYAFAEAPRQQPSLSLSGVEIAANLDLLLTRTQKSSEQIGGALFRLTKADDETDGAAIKRREMGMYAATIAQMQVRENLAGNRTPHHQLCLSIDIQCREVHVAPRTFVQRAQNLENACRFIAALWGSA